MIIPKVCMMTYAMPPEHSGAAIQALTLAGGLAANGARVFFLTQGNEPENLRSTNVAGFRVIRVYKKRLFWKVMAPARFFWVLFRERRNFDLIHVHGVGYLAKIAVLFGRIFGKKTLLKMTMYGEDDAMSVKNGPWGRMNFAFFSLASHYAALTSSFYKSCLDAGVVAGKISLIPNGVDTEKFKPVPAGAKAALRERLGIPSEKKVLVYAGIIRPEKGIEFLLDAVSRLPPRLNAVLLLLGPLENWLSRSEKKAVQRIFEGINALSRQGLVIYPGKTDNVGEYLQASDIFVSASIREGLQNVLLEAMACGLPSVVVEIPEVHRNILDDAVQGFIVKGRESSLFADAITRLLGDPELSRRMSDAARRKALECYSLPVVTAEYMKLYHNILQAAH